MYDKQFRVAKLRSTRWKAKRAKPEEVRKSQIMKSLLSYTKEFSHYSVNDREPLKQGSYWIRFVLQKVTSNGSMENQWEVWRLVSRKNISQSLNCPSF